MLVPKAQRPANWVKLVERRVGQQSFSHFLGGGANFCRLFEQRWAVTLQAGQFFGRQVVAMRLALARFGGAFVGRNQLVFVVVDAHLARSGANPQVLAEQAERCRVVRTFENEMTVAVEFVPAPNGQVI